MSGLAFLLAHLCGSSLFWLEGSVWEEDAFGLRTPMGGCNCLELLT